MSLCFPFFFLFYFIDGLYGIIVGLKQCIDDDDDDDHDRDQYDNEQQLATSIIIVAESTWHQASKYFYSKSYFSIFRFFFVVFVLCNLHIHTHTHTRTRIQLAYFYIVFEKKQLVIVLNDEYQ